MLKYNICFFFAFALSLQLFSQESQNKFLIGGDFSFSNSFSNTPNVRSFESSEFEDPILITRSRLQSRSFFASVKFGKILNAKSTLGITASYDNGLLENIGISDSGQEASLAKVESYRYDVGLFYRFSFFNKSGFKIYLEPTLSLSVGEAGFVNLASFLPPLFKTSNKGIGLNVPAGALYTINNKWNILLNLPTAQLIHYFEDDYETNIKSNGSTNQYSLGLELRNIRIGVERLF